MAHLTKKQNLEQVGKAPEPCLVGRPGHRRFAQGHFEQLIDASLRVGSGHAIAPTFVQRIEPCLACLIERQRRR